MVSNVYLQGHSYTLAMNQFGDLTQNELTALFTWVREDTFLCRESETVPSSFHLVT